MSSGGLSTLAQTNKKPAGAEKALPRSFDAIVRTPMSSSHISVPHDFVASLVTEIACSVDVAVESWMADIDGALHADHLTTLGRMKAVQEVVARYEQLTGKEQLRQRPLLNSKAGFYGR